MTDYAGLKAEIALPKYAGMTDAQIATSLTTPFAITVDVNAVDAFNILQRSSTGDWGKLVARSQQLLSGNPIVMPTEEGFDPRAAPAGNNDVAIVMAKNLTSTYNVERTLLHTSNPADVTAMQRQLTALQAVGDISKASADAIMALPNSSTTRAAQLGFTGVHDMTQEIAAARKWTP